MSRVFIILFYNEFLYLVFISFIVFVLFFIFLGIVFLIFLLIRYCIWFYWDFFFICREKVGGLFFLYVLKKVLLVLGIWIGLNILKVIKILFIFEDLKYLLLFLIRLLMYFCWMLISLYVFFLDIFIFVEMNLILLMFF